jgi:two-component system, chemotaxis family, sensor kinase CheA
VGAADRNAVAGRAGEEFLAEAQEILDDARRDLGALEELVAQGRSDPERVHALFRAVHTLKGLAGTFGVDPVARVSNALEDALDRVRLDRTPLDITLHERLSFALEHVGELLDRVRAASPDDGVRTARVLRELRGEEGAPTPPPIAVDPSVLAVLTEYEEHRLRAGLAGGSTLWRVRATAPIESIDRVLDEVRGLARAVGEVITFVPGGVADDGAHLELSVLVVSTADDATMRSVFADPSRSVERAMPPAAPETDLAVSEPPMLEAAPARAMRSVRVDIGRLDGLLSQLGELSLMGASLQRAVERSRAGDARALYAELSRLQRDFSRNLGAMQRALLEARMVPLGQIFERVSSEVRKLSRRLSRALRLVITGADTAVDKLIVEELGAPLMHIVRNAIDHGIEPAAARASLAKSPEGTLAINAWQAGSRVVVEVEDDGAGVDPAAIVRRAVTLGMITDAAARTLDQKGAFDLLFRPGFTTRDEVSDTSGRGVGLDVVRTSLARLGGVVELTSEPGVFTKVTITLPITLAILSVLLVGVRGRRYALPMSSVSEALLVGRDDVRRIDGREVITRDGRTLPLCRLDALFGHVDLAEARAAERFYAVVIALGGQRAAFAVDAIVDPHDVVVKPLGRSLRHVRWFAGAADLGEQRAGLVLDVVALLDETLGRAAHTALGGLS